MLRTEVLDKFTYGELAQLSIGGLEDDGVRNKHLPQIITNINAGVLDLYKEFPLKTSEVF